MNGGSPLRLTLKVRAETWPLAERFVISRGSKTAAIVLVAEISDGASIGRGECVPYPRYGETPEACAALVEATASKLAAESFADAADARTWIGTVMAPGAARNAVDCAIWDYEAKHTGRTIREMLGLAPQQPVVTAYTLSLDTPDAMAAKAKSVAHLPLLKLKLGGAGDDERLRAVRAARPDARLIADANEAWTDTLLAPLMAVAAETGVEVVEQPLPADADAALDGLQRQVPVCADESLHTRAGLAELRSRYDAVNIKLDKTGGLTEALALANEAERLGFSIMVGSMVSTSLAVAPALLLSDRARWVDLDGPLLLSHDRANGLSIQNGVIAPSSSSLWG